ncbi:MAG: hypothetical protein GEU99_00185 [Luteitalea sp.]|nr:hypothetical protein [Luteitalea sp.]
MSDTIPPPPPPTTAPPPPGVARTEGGGSNRAVIALVLGVLGLVCCYPLGPVAWYLGNEELKAIQAGVVPDTNRVVAQIGMILGVIGTILLGLALLWIFFLGGLAALAGMADAFH